jgi:hypothetical protein
MHTSSSLIEKEKKQLEKIKAKTEKEIKNMIEHETKMNEIRKIQEDKISKQREKERERELELEKKHQEVHNTEILSH